MVSLTSFLGGEGKTLLSILIATQAAKESGSKVILVDGDHTDENIKYLIKDMAPIRDNSPLNKLIDEDLASNLAAHSEELGIDLLVVPEEAQESESSQEEYLELIENLKNHYDYVIVDTPVFNSRNIVVGLVLDLSDLVIIVSGQTPGSVDALSRGTELLAQANEGQIDYNRTSIALNRVIPYDGDFEDFVKPHAHGISIDAVIPNRPQLFIEAFSYGSIGNILEDPAIEDEIDKLVSLAHIDDE